MRRFIGILVLALFPFFGYAAEKEPGDFAKEFFDTYLAGNGSKAIDEFFKTNPLILQKHQQVQLLKSQINTIEQVFGKPFGYESVIQEVLSPSLERHVYITKHEHHPIAWEMYFYKPKTVWLPDQLLFVDQYQVIGAKK